MYSWARSRRSRDAGFTIIELIVALTLIAIVFGALAGVMSGAFGALGAARQRTDFTEIANAEMEALRSVSYDDVGVWASDPKLSELYPGSPPSYDSHPAVLIATAAAPDAVSTASSQGIDYTVRRWVTWWDRNGGTNHDFKRLRVEIEWRENRKAALQRKIALTSVLYPGGLGPVTATNSDPTAVASACVGATCPPGPITAGATTVSFSAAGSGDTDGDPLTYRWDFGDGAFAFGVSTSYVYGAAGNYSPQVTVTDGKGGVAIAALTLNVGPQATNQPPTAGTFTLSPTSGVAPLAANAYSNNDAADPEGGGLSYSWDWGDGATSAGPNTGHTYTTPGTYTVRMVVRDEGGLTAQATQSITVLPLDCSITEGYFLNPSSNSTRNQIVVTGTNNLPKSRSFEFVAKTNVACDSLTGRIPYINAAGREDVFLVVLAQQSQSSGVRVWRGIGEVNNGDMFSLGSNQTGEFWSPNYTGAADKFAFAFTVKK